MKEKKDLSLVYALKEYARVNGKGGPIIEYDRCFTLDDIKAAFNAGRDSVLENMPELEWKIFPTEEYYSTSLLGWSYRIMLSFNEFALFCNSHYLMSFLSVEEAKLAANEDYKKRIKQALGL